MYMNMSDCVYSVTFVAHGSINVLEALLEMLCVIMINKVLIEA